MGRGEIGREKEEGKSAFKIPLALSSASLVIRSSGKTIGGYIFRLPDDDLIFPRLHSSSISFFHESGGANPTTTVIGSWPPPQPPRQCWIYYSTATATACHNISIMAIPPTNGDRERNQKSRKRKEGRKEGGWVDERVPWRQREGGKRER